MFSMVTAEASIHISVLDRLNSRVKSVWERRGYAQLPRRLIRNTHDEKEVESLIKASQLDLITGERPKRLIGEKTRRIRVAYLYDPMRVQAERLPYHYHDEEDSDFHGRLPELLKLQEEGWPLINTDEGAVQLRPRQEKNAEQDSLRMSA